jgi:hypothetical protein
MLPHNEMNGLSIFWLMPNLDWLVREIARVNRAAAWRLF